MNTVKAIGFYGGDETHALSAWTSTRRELTASKRARIDKMLWDLADNEHNTPFEKSALHFLVTTDIASHIHLLKHRIGVSLNAESARYKELKDDKYYVPEDWPEHWQHELERHTMDGFRLYHQATEELTAELGRKRAKESARFFIGYSNQITADVMFNFRSFMHFQKLRNSEHAQREIRDIAQQMLEITRETNRFTDSLKAFKV